MDSLTQAQEESGHKGLAASVIIQAVKDCRDFVTRMQKPVNGPEGEYVRHPETVMNHLRRYEAFRFLTTESKTLAFWCMFLDLDPKAFNERMEHNLSSIERVYETCDRIVVSRYSEAQRAG